MHILIPAEEGFLCMWFQILGEIAKDFFLVVKIKFLKPNYDSNYPSNTTEKWYKIFGFMLDLNLGL